MLHPLGDQADKLNLMFGSMQGFQDMTSAIDSPEPLAVRETARLDGAGPGGDFLTTLSFGGLYAHGTHVRGHRRGAIRSPSCWARASVRLPLRRPRP